jgi:hypothetical protein
LGSFAHLYVLENRNGVGSTQVPNRDLLEVNGHLHAPSILASTNSPRYRWLGGSDASLYTEGNKSLLLPEVKSRRLIRFSDPVCLAGRNLTPKYGD